MAAEANDPKGITLGILRAAMKARSRAIVVR
jgi:hypothetical protein